MHGDREPHEFPIDNQVEGTGAPNEIWSFGKETFDILRKQVNIREALKPYINSCMNEAHEKGFPVMRTLFFEFPEDKVSWNIEDEHMLGKKYLVAPIFEFGKRRRQVYLPFGSRWKDVNSGSIRSGGIWVNCEASLDQIPVFERIDY
jgi:alpha-D-xyloside xylohydrolase